MKRISIASYSRSLVSNAVAEKISNDVRNALSDGSAVVLDFEGVVIITTQCANTILKPAFDIAGYGFKSKVSFSNASQSVSYLLSDAMDYFMLRK